MGAVLSGIFLVQALTLTAYDIWLRRRDGESGWQAPNLQRRRGEWGLDLACVASLLLAGLAFTSPWWAFGEPVPVAIAWWWTRVGRQATGHGRHAWPSTGSQSHRAR